MNCDEQIKPKPISDRTITTTKNRSAEASANYFPPSGTSGESIEMNLHNPHLQTQKQECVGLSSCFPILAFGRHVSALRLAFAPKHYLHSKFVKAQSEMSDFAKLGLTMCVPFHSMSTSACDKTEGLL